MHQVNGLSVLELGQFLFGQPSRIPACVLMRETDKRFLSSESVQARRAATQQQLSPPEVPDIGFRVVLTTSEHEAGSVSMWSKLRFGAKRRF